MKSTHLTSKRRRIRGFSLVEILMVVAVMSTVAATAVITLSNTTQAAQSTKLQRDVRVVNDAIRAYRLNGGTFQTADLSSPSALLAKLKKRATSASAKQLAGLRHSFADARLTYTMQSSDEATAGTERARFIADANNPRFEIVTSGDPGIREFRLDDSLAAVDYGTEVRESTMKLAARDKWVWDSESSTTSRGAPGSMPTGDGGATLPEPPDNPNTQLAPPSFTIRSGTFPLISYPMSVTIQNPNAAGTSQLMYSVDGGPAVLYTAAVQVNPGETYTAYAAALDPDTYDDSGNTSERYETTPLVPSILLTFPETSYTYFELGGPAAPGSPPSSFGPVEGTATFSNVASLPTVYHSSDVFRFHWTYDGSDPRTSGTAMAQADFSGYFTSIGVPLTLASYGTADTVEVNAAIKSAKTSIVTNSAIETRVLTAEVITLPPPTMTTAERELTLALDVSTGEMPENARIFYTLDGTDPGTSATGDPLRGTEYTGTAVELTGATGANLTIRARTYPPVTYRQFFQPSRQATQTYSLPAGTDVYVGGNFVNSSGQPMRNIARLTNSGAVDTRFDTGNGASADSMVGVVRQTGGGVMAGGDFQSMNGTVIPGLVRLNGDGSVDTSFDAGLTSN